MKQTEAIICRGEAPHIISGDHNDIETIYLAGIYAIQDEYMAYFIRKERGFFYGKI